MKVLLTGGAGFIGHHLVDAILRRTEWELTLIDRLDESGNLNRLAEVGAAKNRRVKFVFHDLRAPINDQLAAQIGVPLTLTCGGIVCALGGIASLWLRRRQPG
mgnify:CR=1 FL=1